MTFEQITREYVVLLEDHNKLLKEHKKLLEEAILQKEYIKQLETNYKLVKELLAYKECNEALLEEAKNE